MAEDRFQGNFMEIMKTKKNRRKLILLIRSSIPPSLRSWVWSFIIKRGPSYCYKDEMSEIIHDHPEQQTPLFGGNLSIECREVTMEKICIILSLIHNHYPHLTHVPILPSMVAIICRVNDNNNNDDDDANLSLSQSLSILDLHTRPLTLRKEWIYFPTNQRECFIFISVFKDLLCSLIPELAGIDLDYSRFLFTFFEGILPSNDSFSVFDSFLIEGYKIIFRFGLGIFWIKRFDLINDKTTLFEALKEDFLTLKQRSFSDIQLTSSTIRSLFKKYHKTNISMSSSNTSSTIPPSTHNRIMPTLSSCKVSCKVSCKASCKPNKTGKTIITKTPITSSNPDWLRMIWGWIPERFACLSLRLLYSSDFDGQHLINLRRETKSMEPLLVLIQTMDNHLVGAYLSKNFDLASSPIPYGTGETFIFDDKNPHRWTEENSSFIRITNDIVSLGVSITSPTSSLWFELENMKVGSGMGGTFSNKYSLFSEGDGQEVVKEIHSIEVFGFSL